jgi:hypothetical protein
MTVFGRIRKAVRRLHDEEESGVAMTEFAIAFPLQFFITLALMQFSLLLVGHVLTQHAAFGAARAALVADVPLPGNLTPNPNTMKAQQNQQAKRAACYILMVVCPRSNDGEWSKVATAAPGAIQFKDDDRSAVAYGLTNANMVTTGPDDDHVGALVEFDFPLQIPVVNHWFAKLQGGNPGRFLYDTNVGTGYSAAANTRGRTVYRIQKSSFIPKPWKAQ